ncbi:MAG TPA: MFS transporter [Acidimicrobiia bacterium]|nr:MFS transporter [Acidimicrobiia bacterium]
MSSPRRTPTVVLAVVCFGVFIAADDLTVVSTMLRQIIGALGIPLPDGWDRAAWIVNSYLVAYVAVMPFMGRLSDVFGRRRVFVGALALFLGGSAWIPFTTTLGPFIAGRILSALGGGAMVPVALAVVGDVFEERRRPGALGVLGAVDTIGWVWGPLFGALLVRFLDWRWQFFLNIPLAVIAIAGAWWALADLDRPPERRRIDWAAALGLSTALVCLNVALVNTSEISGVGGLEELTGRRSLPTLPFFLAALVAMGAFLWFERRSDDPLIDLSLVRRPNFAPAMAINFLVGAALIIAMVDVPLFVNLVVETGLKRAAVLSGWVLTALTAAMAVASWAGGRLTERTWYRPPAAAGLTAGAVAFLLMGATWDADVGVWVMVPSLALLGAGLGLVTAPGNAAAVDAVPADRRGVAGGLVILSRLLGLAVGLSGLTAWAIYRFDAARRSLDLPPMTDPNYEAAIGRAQGEITASALAETFLFSALLLAVALAVAFLLHRRRRDGETGPAEAAVRSTR